MQRSLTVKSAMSVFLALAAISVSALSAWFAAESKQRDPHNARNDALTSSLRFNEDQIDVGAIGQGESRKCEFTCTNRSRQPLFISALSPSCSCTTSEFAPHTLQPGETESIPITFHSGAYRGRVVSECELKFSVPGTNMGGVRLLRISAAVEPDIRISHESITFVKGDAAKRSLSLTPGRLASFRVKNVVSTHPAFSVRSLQGRKVGEVVVNISYDPSKWTGKSRKAAIVIITSSEAAPALEIPITVADFAHSVSSGLNSDDRAKELPVFDDNFV